MQVIETQSLTKRYGKARGIEEVSLEVRKGEIFGFIGPNGAGKSTTIRTLLNFLWPTEGRAFIFGLDCAKESARIKRRVGYLPSEVRYYDDMRVGELLAYSASFYGDGRGGLHGRGASGSREARITELAAALELDLSKRFADLSFGNKKKAGIVQALLHEPELLILDEPTGGLDPLMQNRFFAMLEREKERGTTIFFSSHVLSEVERLCDRVAIIKEGRILKVEGMAALKANRYKKVRASLRKGGDDAIMGLRGATCIARDGRSFEFLYSGGIDALVAALARLELENLSIEEPSLEEVFMRYYEGDRK
jgi:ABC-2 type transport system ATP-binding protein